MTRDAQRTRQATTIVSLAGAILTSSCCILPLVLVSLGVSGAWIGTLTSLEPYKHLIALVTLVLLAAGFWLVYRKTPEGCEGACPPQTENRLGKAVLWVATILVLVSLTVELWAPLFY
ncbi:MAG: mercury transporter MerT [Xanthomonadales bacterium]|nr:mercury transporter MerT [Xanthomonadales bacterium]